MSYFTTTKKGEIYELKSDLNSDRREKKKEAVKRVIASMTIGKDVSSLFAECIEVYANRRFGAEKTRLSVLNEPC